MVVELPTGTVPLLFTDIEGSARLLRSPGDGYGTVLRPTGPSCATSGAAAWAEQRAYLERA